ncbi:hypothetical protein [Paenibacillus chitinolyticus]
MQMVAIAAGLIGSVGDEVGCQGYMLTRQIGVRIPYPMLTSGIIWGL